MLTIILSVKIVLTLRVKLPCPKCKILIVRAILVLSFIVSENKNRKKKMEDVLALLLENKRAIHR
jgi:TctA family transporter